MGISLVWDYVARTLVMSMPSFVPKALKRYNFRPRSRTAHSPGGFIRPVYGAKQQLVTEDESPLLDLADVRRIQSIVGTFLWYCRVVDSTALVALGILSSEVAQATMATARKAEDILQYFHSYPSAAVTFHASEMRLFIHSDASYLSECRAGSRLGGIEYLGSTGDADKPPTNGAVNIISCRSDVVVSSACEAEWAALYKMCREACDTRETLANLSYPQPPTLLTSDNQCAVGLSNGTVKPRRSKAMDMRFHWVNDRVRQGQFAVRWAPGTDNFADFFTKLHPVSHHKFMRTYYVDDITV